MGYQETDIICDDEKKCRCVIERQGCDAPCTANGKDGMCKGKFGLQRTHYGSANGQGGIGGNSSYKKLQN